MTQVVGVPIAKKEADQAWMLQAVDRACMILTVSEYMNSFCKLDVHDTGSSCAPH